MRTGAKVLKQNIIVFFGNLNSSDPIVMLTHALYVRHHIDEGQTLLEDCRRLCQKDILLEKHWSALEAGAVRCTCGAEWDLLSERACSHSNCRENIFEAAAGSWAGPSDELAGSGRFDDGTNDANSTSPSE